MGYQLVFQVIPISLVLINLVLVITLISEERKTMFLECGGVSCSFLVFFSSSFLTSSLPD